MQEIEVERGNLDLGVHKRYNDAPFSLSTTSNWIAKAGGLPPYVRAVARGIMRNGHSESEAIQMAIGVMSNWIASPHTKPETKAKATAALAWWEALKAKAHASRSDEDAELFLRDVGEWSSAGPPGASSVGMDPSGAANLLPVGPSKKQSDAITHRFVGTDLTKCGECGRPILDPIHSRHKPGQPIAPIPREAKLLRHPGPDHLKVSSGHLAGHVTNARRQNERHMASVEGPLADALRSHFADQRRVTINRLLAKNNGKRLMKHAVALLRAEGDEPIPPDSPYVIPPDPASGAPASVNPAMIFLPSYWADKTAEVISPHLSTATVLAAGAVNHQLGVTDGTSLGPLQGIVAQRAHAAAQYITGVTAKDLSEALQQGVAHGEGMAAIASRVNDVFDTADIARAKQIAQTEVVGAYNEGATQYAQSLPVGIVGSKRWISHRDDRTRTTHRLADGQEQPLDQPYWVGGAAMMHPGDKAAPVGEWINCRCNQVFLPPGLAHSSIADAAAAYVAGLKAVPA